MGLLVHRSRADWIVGGTTILTCIAPLLMAFVQPSWSYWAIAFPAVFLNPLGNDGIFTIANLLITSLFPSKTQGLAGGVFNTVSQIGKSVGLALVTLIANRVTARTGDGGSREAALMEGYRASFWFLFALSGLSLVVSALGLRTIGRIGVKEE